MEIVFSYIAMVAHCLYVARIDGTFFHFGCLPPLQPAHMEVSTQAKEVEILIHFQIGFHRNLIVVIVSHYDRTRCDPCPLLILSSYIDRHGLPDAPL